MDSQTWTTTLTIRTDDQSFLEIREWLADYDADNPSPRRNDDLLAKYLRCVLDSNNQWDGIRLGIGLSRPRLARLPWQQGFEGDPPPAAEVVRAQRDAARRRQFAVDCFALLVLLIVGATGFAAYHVHTHQLAALPSSYTASDSLAPGIHAKLAQGGD